MAQGFKETGMAEGYMNARVRRALAMRKYSADYLGNFESDIGTGGFAKGSSWLIWRFESDSTLGDALTGQLREPFPDVLAEIYGCDGDLDDERREATIIRKIFKRILKGLCRMHELGIVHRDIKPENLLITDRGEVKLIDFGAAADMSTGINFSPRASMLDPRYSPPEQFVLPRNTPKIPTVPLCAAVAPAAWFIYRPDLFDSYSAGLIFLQMAIPQLRARREYNQFVTDLDRCGNDLMEWRLRSTTNASRCDFGILDRKGGLGWDLACKLVQKRNTLLRGRMSTQAALRHPYFLVPV